MDRWFSYEMIQVVSSGTSVLNSGKTMLCMILVRPVPAPNETPASPSQAVVVAV